MFLRQALLIAALPVSLCVAPAALVRASAGERQVAPAASDSLSSFLTFPTPDALTNASHSGAHGLAARHNRLRQFAPDFSNLPAEYFQVAGVRSIQSASDANQAIYRSSFSIRPRGRAPPLSF